MVFSILPETYPQSIDNCLVARCHLSTLVQKLWQCWTVKLWAAVPRTAETRFRQWKALPKTGYFCNAQNTEQPNSNPSPSIVDSHEPFGQLDYVTVWSEEIRLWSVNMRWVQWPIFSHFCYFLCKLGKPAHLFPTWIMKEQQVDRDVVVNNSLDWNHGRRLYNQISNLQLMAGNNVDGGCFQILFIPVVLPKLHSERPTNNLRIRQNYLL